MKLPKAFKNKWVKALRSGKYAQTHKKLGSVKEGFCCLGLCLHINGIEFNSEAGVIAYKQEVDNKNTYIKGLKDFPKILKGDCNSNLTVGQLVYMNDEDYSDFKEISDYIEKNL